MSKLPSAWNDAGRPDAVVAHNQSELDAAIAQGTPVSTDNADLLCHASDIDVLIEATADVEFVPWSRSKPSPPASISSR